MCASVRILVTLLARIYLKYRDLSIIQGVLKSLRPAVVAMIGAAGVSILVTAFWGLEGFSPNLSALNLRSVCIFAGAVVLLGPVPDESDSCHGPVRRGRDRLSAGYEGPLKCLIDFNPFPL